MKNDKVYLTSYNVLLDGENLEYILEEFRKAQEYGIEELKRRKLTGANISDLVLEITHDYDYLSTDINIYRSETDEEYKTRLEKQKKWKEDAPKRKAAAKKAAARRKKNKELKELKLFNKLREKYGNKEKIS